MLVILSGVAGAGKDTIKKEIIKRMDNVKSIPSFTSRPPREGDVPGQTYIFLSKEEFEEKIRNDEIYEYDIHHNNYYGTSKKILNEESKSSIICRQIFLNLLKLKCFADKNSRHFASHFRWTAFTEPFSTS